MQAEINYLSEHKGPHTLKDTRRTRIQIIITARTESKTATMKFHMLSIGALLLGGAGQVGAENGSPAIGLTGDALGTDKVSFPTKSL